MNTKTRLSLWECPCMVVTIMPAGAFVMAVRYALLPVRPK